MGGQIEEHLKLAQRKPLKHQNPIKEEKEGKTLSSKSAIKD